MSSGNGKLTLYVNNASVGSVTFSGQIGAPKAENNSSGSGSYDEPTVMAMGCNPKGNRAQTEYKDGCFTAMNLYNLKIYNETGCVASYEAKRNVGALKDLTGHNDGNVRAEDWTNEYIQLDGKDDWINLGQMSFRTNQVTLDLTTMILSKPSKNTTLIGNLESGGVALGLTTDLKPTMQINVGGTYYKAVSSSAISLNQKVHVLGVYDGTNIMIFVNGQLTGKTAQTGAIKEPGKSTVMSIGSNPSGNSAGIEFTNMRVYMAHIYDKAYWDVSEKGDNSILAWTVNGNGSGTKKVYIASKGNIYANADASYMFSNIGAASICTATTALTNLNLLKTANTTNMYSMFWKTGYNAMTSLDLGTSFSTAKATNLEYMFQECGYKAMTSLNLRGINTSAATSMYAMFDGTGYTAMTSLNLGDNFSTANVTKMTRMFKNCGYTKMTTLTLGTKFNTAKVTEMANMFEGTGHTAMTSLSLGSSFNTSQVTDMQAMFKNCGYTAMTTLALGNSFNTAKVKYMQEMFANTGYTAMTKLDLGDIFYTTAATNMTSMFNATGYTVMGELDLGPAFTKIAGTYSNVFTNTGKSGCRIYATEAIYQNSTTFKLNTSSGTQVGYSRGTIDPRYRVEWIIEPNSVSVDKTNKKMTIGLRARTNNNATSYYKSNITGSLGTGNITVYIDGEAATSISKSLSGPTSVKNGTTGYNDVKYTLTLTGFEQGSRKSGKQYKEWSGNVQLSIAQGTATDSYGNKNMAVNNDGSRANHWLDTSTRADFIKPEFTYNYSATDIDKTNKRLIVDFTVTDKFFSTTTVVSNMSKIVVKLIDENKEIPAAKISKSIVYIDSSGKEVASSSDAKNIYETRNGTKYKIGERYRLIVTGLEQSEYSDPYRNFSGTMSVTFPAGTVTDTSSNSNNAQVITIGINEPDKTGSSQIVDVVDPVWKASNFTVDKANQKATVVLTANDKYYKSNSLTRDSITVKVGGTTVSSIAKQLSAPKTVTNGVQYTLTLTNWEESTRQSGKYYYEWSGNVSITIAANTIEDTSGNKSKAQTFSLGFADVLKPKIDNITVAQDKNKKTVTVGFDVSDKYLKTSTVFNVSNISIYIDGENATNGISKSLTHSNAGSNIVDGNTVVVRHHYVLTLSNFEESGLQNGKVYKEWSGSMKIALAGGIVQDTSGNSNAAIDLVNGEFVDFINPVVAKVSSTKDASAKTDTIRFTVTDKYLNTTLSNENINVYVDGENATSIKKDLSIESSVTKTINGTNRTVQRTYKLVLSSFEQSSFQNGKPYKEWSGNVKITIASGIIKDTKGNTVGAEIAGDFVDFIRPTIAKYSSSKDVNAKKETIVFDVYDKYIDNSTKLSTSDITVYMDNEAVPAGQITRELSNNPTPINGTVNGSTKQIGQRYTLTLTNFEQATLPSGKSYKEWSGTVKIGIAEGKVKDTSKNTNVSGQVTGDFVDFVKPSIIYKESNAVIDKNGKKYTMVFGITDKYYDASKSTKINKEDLGITIDGENPTGATKTLSDPVPWIENGKTIGVKYTLVVSDLQQSTVNANKGYKDYSGVFKVVVPANKIKDTTGNANVTTTITSGIDIPTNTGTGKIIDVVDPYWQVSNININHNTNQVTMTIKGTDKYFEKSTLTPSDIEVWVDEEIATSITKTLSPATSISNGVQYTLTLSNWQESSKQSGKSYLEWSGNTKIRIKAGTMKDTYENLSKLQEFTIGQVDFIKPMIEKVSSTKGTNNETIVFDVNDKYISTKLSAANITTLINGEVADVKTTITSISDIKGTGKFSAKTVGHRYTVVISNFNKGRKNGRKYSDWSGTVSLRIAADAVQDTSQNKNNATTITGDFVDFIKPEITYIYSSGNIDHTNKTLTVDFTVADRYFSTSTVTTDEIKKKIKVKLKENDKEIPNLTGKINITKLSDYSDGTRGKVGENYRLTIGGLQQNTETDGLRDYSGPMSITFPADMVKDTEKKGNDAKTITIGVNDPGTGSQQVVDVVSPVWSKVSADVNTGIVKIRVKDKYLLKTGGGKSNLTLSLANIAVFVNGTESTQVTKTITSGPTLVASGSNGYDTTYEYTIKLGNIAQTTTNYIEFTPKEKVVGGKAKYRDENGGEISLRIKAGAIKDAFENMSEEKEIPIGNIDNTGPEVYDIQKTIAANGDETFVFNITDKNYDSSKIVSLSELNITIDGAQFSSAVQKKLTSQTLTDSNTNKVLGHQYTLKLTNMKESNSSFMSALTSTTNRRAYREYSGTIRIVINSNAARDLKGNTLNTSTTTITSFNDKLAPEVVYIWSNSIINKNSKTFTMIFDITDKYYASSSLAIGDLTIKIGGKTPNWSSNEVGRSLSVSDIPGATGKGKRYTLTLSNLQKLQIKSGDKYLDYSGVVTVAIPANKVKDTSGQENVATTLTSGITIPGGTGSEKEVDVVEPYVQKMSSTVNAVAKTASITVRISDRYFNTSTLTKDTIEVYINGTKNSAVKTGWSTSDENESRTEKGTTSTVHIATNYTLNISGFDSNINQIKVVVPANVVTDTSGNGNKQTEYIIYNVLRSTASETDATSGFLGNSNVQRQNVDSVTFVSSTSGKNSTAWDVSAQQDKSIYAWYTTSNGAYKVNIGSDSPMFGNIDSSGLFQYVGENTVCTTTKTITNLNLLNVSSVINMHAMFRHTGYNAMTELDLGSNFDTSNVSYMSAMFGETGYKAMTTLNLGSKFNTSKVTDMTWMFGNTGYNAMTKLDLGSNFDTSNVGSMYAMFNGTGSTAMTSLNLGNKFNTAKVTNMEYMFAFCGNQAMTSLDLGSKFNTSNVTKMNAMFLCTGFESMTNLNLGTHFDTGKVTEMAEMFNTCGFKKMTTLDLGDKFSTQNVTIMKMMFKTLGVTSLDLGELFDTSNVTNMDAMFEGCDKLVTLNLGDKFDTSNVTTMIHMFKYTGRAAMKSLSLGDKFYTKNVTDMYEMFAFCGENSMTTLDLGPAFNYIQSVKQSSYNNAHYSGETIPKHNTYDGMFDYTGKSGSVVIYAPESIYQDKNNFKLNTSSGTKINYTRGTINARYRTEWKKESVTVDETNKKVMITLRGRTNPEAGTTYVSKLTSSLATGNIKVYINGTEVTSINKTLDDAKYDKDNPNDVLQTLTLSNIEQGRVTGKEYKEYSGNISLEIAQGNLTDKYGNKNMAVTSAGARTGNTVADGTVQKNTSNTMFADMTKPEFTYVYADSDINHTTKTLTAVFKVADKYRASTAFTKKSDGTYDASSITVGIDSYDKTALNNAISKKLTLESETTEEISGQNRATVQTYKLVIGNLEQKGQGGLSDGYTYSGILTLGFPEGTITDTSGHKSPATTITIGKNEPGGTGTGKPVDVVDPVWSVVSTNADTGVVKLRVKDKYLTKSTSKFNLAKDSIKIIVNGVESTAIVKTLEGPTTIIDGQEYEYTLTLSNIAPSGGGYTEFTPLETIVGGTAKYRNDNGGSITIRIPAGAVTDANGNKTKQQDLNVGNMDLTEPEVYFVQKNRDLANNQETIIFNVTDKNYDSTKLIAANELTTWVDGTQMDSKLTKSISSKTISTRIDEETRVVGHQYTLVLKGFAESDSAFASSGRVYREYSGNLQVKINKDAARDKRGNTLNSSTTTIAQITDVVRPDIKAKWSDAVINKNNKTFTMIFDVTDKYYSTSTLEIEDLTIKIGGKTPDWSSNEVGRSLSVSDIPGGVGNGKRYTLTLSNLQALQIKSGDKYLDYSGVVTVAIPANKVKDTTGNTNLAKTITSGITIPGETGSEKEVDVVEPYVQKMSSTVNAVAKTASITVRISDRYFNTSTLTKDTIEVYINGTKNSAVKTGWSTSEETETRTEKGTTSTVHVATNYTLNMSGFASNINQIKVVVPANVVKDTSENGNKQTEYIIYNVLRKQDDRGEDDTAPFLGNATVPRKDIDNVTFVSSTAGKNSTAWDVSAQGDSSILAWYTKNSNGTFKVYVGSDYEMFGNTDSSYLFRSVGVSENCTSTETITNINLLNVSSVTNMYRMFELTGNQAMTKLDLGDNFNTSNVTDMGAMFSGTGQKAMTTLNLGSNFNTSRVTNMRWMFNYTGRDKMTSLNLGNNFDTSNAQYMEHMFSYTGYYSMTTLNLGSKFNTSKVKYMEYMFCGCGYNALTSLDLGSNFDTSSVTNMTSMFQECGYNALTSLDLGSNFDTSNVTNMASMFEACGYTTMTYFNLGSKFNTSKVTDMNSMFARTGREKLVGFSLGDKFDTSKVTSMAWMFSETGYTSMTSLDLGDKFDTSNVTNMIGMFNQTGWVQMSSLNLGNKFNTSKVTDMRNMFFDTGSKLTSLDLGDQFYTTNVTNMIQMFENCGYSSMVSLDLGPAFTQIPSDQVKNWNNTETHEAYYKMFESTGKSGCVIHAPESIFQDKNNFKLNTSATTGTINWTRGTINPKYRTEWKKESATLDTTNKNIKITLRGTTNTAIAVDQYKSDVTSTLTKSNIKVYIDGVNATESLNKLNAISLGNATQTTENSRTGAKDVLQVVTLSNLEEAARQSGKSYKEWSGNIRLEIDQKTLTDTKYGNKNMAVTSTGARANHTFADGTVQNNTADKMFADYIKPEITYTYVDSDINHTNKTLTAEFILTDKYYKQGFTATNGKYDASSIIVGIDSYDKTALNKAITKTLTKIEDVTDTVNGVANVKVGEKYRLVIGNLEQKGQDGMSDGYTYSGNMSLAFPEGTATDKSGNKSPAKTITIGKNEPGGTGSGKVVDVVDPVWEKGDVEAGTETGVVKLKVKDKYLVKADSTFALTKEQIKIIVNNKESTAIVKTLTGPIEKVKDQEYEYTLTLSNISPADAGYTEFTPKNPIVGGKAKYKNENGGNISLKIPAGAITDKYGNSTKEQIIDVGIFDGTGPAIYYVQKNRSIGANKETVIFNVTDKNYDSTDPITIDEMSVTIGGTTVDPKNLVITKAVEIITNVDGKTDVVVGHQYTLEILNIEETDQDFIKSGRKYRELSGDLKIQINEDAARDLKGNTIDTDTTTINDYSDIVRPEVIYTYSTPDINYEDKTFTMVFEMVDKYYNESKSNQTSSTKKLTPDNLTPEDLTITIGGKTPDWDNDKISRALRIEKKTAMINGENKVIGRIYTLTITGLDQEKIKTGDKYADYSGVVSVTIPENIMIDDTGNANVAKTISSGVSIPSGSIGKIGLPKNNTVMVMGANPTINTVNDGFSKMKAYSLKISDENGVISSYDATKNTGSSHSNSTTTWKDLTGSNNGTVNGATWGTDYLQFDGVDDWVNFGQINSQNQVKIEATISIDQISGEDDIAGNWESGGFGLYLINGIPKFSVYGKDMNKYVEISAPNVLAVRKKTTLKGVYDGVNMYLYVDDELVAQTSNSGTSATVVDVVDPLVTKLSSTTNAPAKTATVKFKVTDKYFDSSTLTKDNIEVLVNGAVSNSVGKTLTGTNLTETRVENGKTSTVQYGIEYTLNITDFAADANQIKVRIPADKVKDKLVDGKQNGNKQTDIMVYNVLRKQDDKGEDDTAPFLGNATVPRKDIDNVTFVSSTAGKNSTAWDVSAQGDSSILAWYTKNSNGTFKVYVGSDYEIFGNTDSSYLFRSVGLSDYCTSTETITNINLLNVSSVTNMLRMFELTGNQAMTKLDLGDNFNTSNVINMGAMFSGTGQKAMTTLNFGSNFNTLRVTNMNYMFNTTGRDKMTSLNLGSNFDTSNVTSMYSMFRGTGYGAMTTLNLGSKFNTSKVTDMSYMFHECGYTAMTSLNLGANFDTSKVTNMDSMFHSVGHTAMTSFNLGDKFNTSNVTNMNAMFAHMGWKKLTGFSLGDKFNTSKVTSMEWMFSGTGYDSMISLNLGNMFDTSNVTTMRGMFNATGSLQMSSLNLENKFNTSKVTNMVHMFHETGFSKMTSLDLGDQFYTTNVTNMMQMFENCGSSNMTSLDLGPAFTKIPSGTGKNFDNSETHEVYYRMFINTGKSGCVIHAPESIFQNKNNFKLNANATTGTVNYTQGTIDPKYRTEWKKEKVVLDQANDNIKITLRGTTNTSVAENEYISDVTSSLALNKIKVLIDGTDITSTVLNAQEIGNATQTTENSRTGAKDVLQTITLTNFAKAAKRLNGKKYKEWSGNITIEIAQGTLSEKYGNKNMLVATDGTRTVSTVKETNEVSKNTANTMFTDYIKPEFTYSSITDTNIVHGTGRKVEVMFDVTDKYFESTTLSNLNASQITIGMDDYDETELNKAITKKLEKVGTITDTVNGVSNVTVGERYKLTITGLEQQDEKGLSDGYTYSGYMSLKFAKGTIKDKSGNLSDATTITIGKNEPGGSDTDKTVVDIVDPVWTLGDVDTNDGTIKLRVKDKFLIKDSSKFELTTDKITIYADDVVSTEIEKQISGPVEIRANEEYEYTLTLLNIKPDGDEYEEFTPKNPIVGGTAKYKKENGGDIKIKIAAGAVTDAYGNKTKEQIIDPGNIDGTGPEVYDIQKTKDAANNKETFVFNVTDKNYDSTDLVTIDELTVWLDGKQVDIDGKITKKFVGDPVEIITTVNGQERVVGHQYTLEIESIVETNAEFVASNRKYRELSGTLEVKIATDAAKDKKGNKINPDTATITDFNDMIKPEVIYKYATSNIDKTNKTFKMEFNLVDKYCATISNIAVTDLTIKIDNKVPDWTKVTRNLEVSDIKEPVNGTNKLIGRHYTLTLSNLEQLQVKSGDNYLDYSGVITVAIPANKMQDTAGNQNVTTTITSGVSIPAGTGSDTVVDVVDPLIEKISSTVDAPAKTATLNFKVTDKYFASSDLANGNIEILVNGAKNTTVAANNALTVVKNLTEPRTVDGKTVQVQYGIEYSLKISGFDANANQIKVRFPANLVKDKAVEGKQNGNKQTDIVVYNVLRSAENESEATSAFLGSNNSTINNVKNIQRQNIDKVTFMNNIPETVLNKSTKEFETNANAWDVSAQQDKSIVAWYNSNEVSNGTYKVYIGSDSEIFANRDSTWLFSYIGYSNNCTSTETIKNLELMNTANVTKMSAMFAQTGYNAMNKLDLGNNFITNNVTQMDWMFSNCGYNNMTTFSLGNNFNTNNVSEMRGMFNMTGYMKLTSLELTDKFNTSKVTDMSSMFEGTGYTAMTSLNLGANFDTSKVTNMSNMFNSTGYAKMASLDLKAKFNTSKVTNMSGMFASTGHELMTTLNLGANFDTSAVTDMSSMFEATGYKKMATLNLREKFNTSKVTNMSKMFKNTGFTAMTSLDLGNTFYTTVATDTSEMFNNTGATAMTILDLGPAFDRIPDTNTDMFKNTGTAALVVYAPEAIYSNVTTFIANRTRN